MPGNQDLTGITLDGRYRLTRLMGEGGMGQVYAGVHVLLDHQVAVKVLLPRFAHESTFRERFLREAKAASKVRHPNVVQIIDFGDTPNGSVYFVMEFLQGRDLQDVLREQGSLPWPRARSLLVQIASALGAAHEHRIIHRDVKPANCFVIQTPDHQELVKLLDFGIAKITAPDGETGSSLAKNLTGTGEVFGTAKYMAPEQAVGSSNDPRVDVYSVGIMAYEMLTGQVPFTGPSTFHIITKHFNEPPRPPRELNPQIPWEAEALILRALAKQPEERLGSMKELEQGLLAIAPHPGAPASVPPVPSYPPYQSGLHPSAPIPPSPGLQHPPVQLALPPAPHHPPSGGNIAAPVAPIPPVGSGVLGLSAESGEGRTEPQSSHSHSETLQHGLSSRPPARSHKGVILGLIGVAAGLGFLVTTLLMFDAPQEPEPIAATAPTAPAPVEEVPIEISSTIPADDEISQGNDTSQATGSSPAEQPNGETTEGERLATTGALDQDAADPDPPEPAIEPKPSSKSSRPTQSRTSKPPTDKSARSNLARALRKKCRSLGAGSQVRVNVVVGSDGRVLTKNVDGASGQLKQCLLDQTAKAKFPAGSTRRITVQVSL